MEQQPKSAQSDSLYNGYDKENPSEADSLLRHCLACNRLGHDARNCPCPSTAMILAHYQILEEIRNYKTLAMDGTVMTLEGTIMHPHSQEPFDEPDSNWPKMPKFGNFMETDTFVDSSSSVPKRKSKRKERTVTNDENIKSAGQDTAPIDSVVGEKLSTIYILKLHIMCLHSSSKTLCLPRILGRR